MLRACLRLHPCTVSSDTLWAYRRIQRQRDGAVELPPLLRSVCSFAKRVESRFQGLLLCCTWRRRQLRCLRPRHSECRRRGPQGEACLQRCPDSLLVALVDSSPEGRREDGECDVCSIGLAEVIGRGDAGRTWDARQRLCVTVSRCIANTQRRRRTLIRFLHARATPSLLIPLLCYEAHSLGPMRSLLLHSTCCSARPIHSLHVQAGPSLLIPLLRCRFSSLNV